MLSNLPHRLFFRPLALLVVAAVSFTMSAYAASAVADEGSVAQTAATTAGNYDFSPYTAETMLELFAKALDDGRTVPTEAEFTAAGFLPTDLAFIRSHVKKAPILDRSDRLVDLTYKDRQLFLNFPCATEENKQGGFPSGKFNTDCFSMWQYTNLYGAWNHSFFQTPAAWVDAAHRNGTDMLSGLEFFESWNSGDAAWVEFCTKRNADGSFRYVKPLINALLYFGHDGINFNWEDDHYANVDVVAFHKALYKEAERVGFDNFHVMMYTSNTALGYSVSDAIFGSKATGKTTDLMLNYADGDFSSEMFGSAMYAEQLMGTCEGLYAGVHILTMDRSWDMLSPRYLEIDDEESLAYLTHCGICLWGEHGSTWFWGRNEGATDTLFQDNYQRLLERGFSGGNRNPADRPMPSSTGNNWQTTADGKAPLSTFCGLAEYIPERSAIQGALPFVTHFNLGNGAVYAYKGKRTAGAWTNLSMQDYVPTFRWLVLKAGTDQVSTDVQPEFTHNDAYTGGSCLSLKGTATAEGTDIVLYKTSLTAVAQPTARLAVKTGLSGANASHLSLLLRLKGSTQWKEYEVGDVQGVVWNEKVIALPGIAQGDVIDRIALRVKGGGEALNVWVGKLLLEDGTTTATSSVSDVVAEVREETKTSLSVKLAWDVAAKDAQRADWQMLTNDEANVHHFEVLLRHGENGRVSEVMRTASWAALVPHITFTDADDYVYVGVRAVSTDLHTCSPVVWTRIPRSAQADLSDDKTPADLTFSTMDRGTADEPDGLADNPSGIDDASSAAVPTVKVSGRNRISVTGADRVWIYTPDGRLLSQQACSGTAEMSVPLSGSYVVRMQRGRVVHSVVLSL